MSSENEVICTVCNKALKPTKFCANCGAKLLPSEIEEVLTIFEKLSTIKNEIDKICYTIYQDLTQDEERILLNFRDEFEPLYEEFKQEFDSANIKKINGEKLA